MVLLGAWKYILLGKKSDRLVGKEKLREDNLTYFLASIIFKTIFILDELFIIWTFLAYYN